MQQPDHGVASRTGPAPPIAVGAASSPNDTAREASPSAFVGSLTSAPASPPSIDPAVTVSSEGRRRHRQNHRRYPTLSAIANLPSSDATSRPPRALLTSHYRSLYYRQHPPQNLAATKPWRPRKSTKRPPRQDEAPGRAMDRAPVKKARTGASPPRRFEIPPSATIPPPSLASSARDGSSPLFFSHAPARILSRPSGSTASEIAASMLSRGRDDPAGIVTTVKLPRASVSSSSRAMSGSTPGSLASSMDMSSDSRNLPAGLQAVQGIGAIELLEHDDRPTFLLCLAGPLNLNRPGLEILYYNGSLRCCPEIQNLLAVDSEDTSVAEGFDRFKSWAYDVPKNDDIDTSLPYHEYGGITWTRITLRQRFRFISGNVTPAAPRSITPRPRSAEPAAVATNDSPSPPSVPTSPAGEVIDPPDYFGDAAPGLKGDSSSLGTIKTVLEQSADHGHPDEFTNQVLQFQPTKNVFDWTRVPVADSLPEHIKFAKSVDWASTPLGPISEWSYDLRAMSNLIMGSPHPAAMYWGPDLICIYNAAYIELAGRKHPSLMGQKYTEAWSEIWPEIEPIFKSAWECGQATMKHDNRLFIRRAGFLEETFFSWAIVPLVGNEGEVVGLYNPAFENTLRRVNDRRMLTLREIGERTAMATTVSGFWPQVQKGLEYNECDAPFALIYSIKEEAESEASSLHSGSFMHSSQIMREGSPGVPEGHPAAPHFLDLRMSEEGFAPYMRQCMAGGGEPLVLSENDGTLPKDLIKGINWRGFGDACTTIVVFPVVPTTKEAVTGFIVLGLNPRRPYDDNYKLFIHLLSRQLATSMASVVLFEEEIRRGQRAARLAALDRQELSMQLLLRTQEANESEFRFTRMAEFAPVGMFTADAQGRIDYCNDMWWQISRHSRFDETGLAWMSSVRDEDRPSLDEAWQKLLQERMTISVEFRFKHSQQSGGNTMDTWVLMSAFPEKNGDGGLKSIFGCLTDISSQKWAEKVQNERREEAVELKRQQENFIDITSHEMRNPLSAVLQCADQIANNITAFTAHDNKAKVETLLESCLDAANTINLCASHQKRIVDDILTLSKLDSNLLAVTPIDEQPVKVVQRALKMFESELMAHDIELYFNVDGSFEKHGVEWAKLDPSRLRQVLINLMTNAIKFTQGRDRRSITVSLSVSKDIGEVTSQGVLYFDKSDSPRTIGMDIANEKEWGGGERINLHCSVEDTGPGLDKEELKVLFQRFQQATPRTHVQYGGSGLGLFISRILTEMQGGQIGVTSARGSGSRFNFYIQSRRKVQAPAMTGPQLTATPPSRMTPPVNVMSLAERPLFDVLIVEDNIVNQMVLQRQLRDCGNKTFVANHGREALQTLQKSRFWAGQESEGVDISVILMDLEMPVMDGMTCARKIRELEREGTIVKHIPIIAVTAYARPEQIENAKAAGIDDVISKPFRIPELIPKIEELVAKYEKLSVSANGA
ncbi:histidine kinase-, DNA gyrase b-, and HSP90-like ATPase domain-containing protein [Hirsutella rhossiliensis]|uniref:Histidine kinase-, DNA gyrase b-, and HSP90-like ATPase domain-containing protein n=1 Tax=Hirsutella rhossiliensis TaxID=111463 RepID=A0A9P8MWC7_9HYPO|nr:histidine kinase-, DNA gyrase b-, and HSP90-like ATPase domain-containing protein [Hirsutella rhossiliensis]KAH0962445.1 histidine kinase-, DNA gyrase b-, and HSP90-like ATPase domain-containing protein [Hirsutella rhossiliensis]